MTHPADDVNVVGTVEEVLEDVGDSPGRAVVALAHELANKNRPGLVDALAVVIAGGEP